MEDYDTISSMPDLNLNTLEVFLYSRPSSLIDLSTVVIWVIAIFTVYLGARKAIEDDKDQYYTYDYSKKGGSADDSEYGLRHDLDEECKSDHGSSCQSPLTAEYGSLRPQTTQRHSPVREYDRSRDDSMDITFGQAILFIFASSCFLILLYFVDLYAVVSIIYLASAAVAIALVSFEPMLKLCLEKSKSKHRNDARESSEDSSNAPLVLSVILGLSVSACWYYFKTSSSWIWIVQDILGMNVCILFLSIIRVPNLKIASTLLCLAFLYDVFFVFISPYIFSSSVMLTVAESSSTTTVSHSDDENYCEKYPDSVDCETSTLPMLFIVPTFTSFVATSSMLGLGDIVLPGMLLVWTARLDIRRVGYFENLEFGTSYFFPALMAYSLGLFLADIAVSVFETGQPALLYSVPLVLGIVWSRATESGTLDLLWDDLPPMKTVARPVGFEEQVRGPYLTIMNCLPVKCDRLKNL